MTRDELLGLAARHYGKDAIDELARAVDFATSHHEGQKRKSGEPYIIHPLSVASILIDWGMDIGTVVAGVLHDTVEDTAATLTDIEASFGRDVSFLVDGVTKVSQARAGMRNLDSYLPITKDNLAKLLIAVGEDVRVIIIKLADRLHNMQTLQHMSPAKQKKIARETIEVFAPLADRLNMGRVRVQLEELSFKYLMPQAFNETKLLMSSRIKKSQRKLDRVRREVAARLKSEGLVFEMDGRVKSVYSLYKKMDRVGDIDKIYDLIALRIIVDDISTAYLVLNELHDIYTPMFDRTGQIVEFQIRTREMHEYAERGLAAGFHYNESKLTDAYRKGEIAALPADLEWIRELQVAASRANEGKEFDSEKFRMKLFSDRIFVNSPNGDIYNLPKGSFPLDYAYRIHSDLAARTSGFKINGVMKPFDYVLQHGDVVEVLTNKSARPKTHWKELVITTHAKNKLRAQLAKEHGLVAQLTGGVSSLFKRKK
ncbi:metal-dependent phosphohydrolase [Candidatus Saccharibacteria bacterium 32-49-10]|nr:MAG: metal-dependent phosphohydrolase [Candidatus Saccharibacteria bacterium 32-49-10]